MRPAQQSTLAIAISAASSLERPGPEAGVWVIAETTDLATKFAKVVVTDERGRYVVPDLPKASYSLWVRGYGLVDLAKVQSTPGKLVKISRRFQRRTRPLPRNIIPVSTGTRY